MVLLQNNSAQHCSLTLKLSIYLWPYTKSYQTLDSEFESETKRLVYELLSWRNFSKIIPLNPSYCLINTLKFTAKVKSLVTHQKLTKVNTARNQVKFKFSPSQRQNQKHHYCLNLIFEFIIFAGVRLRWADLWDVIPPINTLILQLA